MNHAGSASTGKEWKADEAFARGMDAQDPLRSYRELFHVPTVGSIAGGGGGAAGDPNAPCVYLTGNSLGLMPRSARAAVEQELDDWSRLAVEAHFEGKTPWFSYHEVFREMGSRLVGARPGEVVMMNSLTVNLHLMMASFYRPTKERFKIVIEDSAFPSDSYAVQSQAGWHGLNPSEAVVRLRSRAGEELFRTEDVEAFLHEEGRSVALLLLGGVNYRTGQLMDMARITEAARRAGAIVGWDLAHAAGNVPLDLHEWGADFACWCSYKYLNSGPGAVAGCFVHERHGKKLGAFGSKDYLPRFAGWWGNDPATRFKMGPDFTPREGADGWQISNPPIMALAPLKASLEIFDRAGMKALRTKSEKLTAHMEWLLRDDKGGGGPFEVITPVDPGARGCQLSIRVKGHGKELLKRLRAEGIICDWREPDVVRAAPVPLYNTFHDVWRFVTALRRIVGTAKA